MPPSPAPAEPKPRPSAPSKERPTHRRDTHRDFIEQIVGAFILAFLVRGFEAEAFVIPTGSMAPTLMGAHKEVVCPECGYLFTVNAADEFEQHGSGPARDQLYAIKNGICGNCRAPVLLINDPTFNGDRILVMKALLNLPWLRWGAPARWDVMVFHYPEEPEVNYIKRMVGMPNQDTRIYFGDILARPRGTSEPFRLQSKPLNQQQAMQINVWDDRHRPRMLAERFEWQRWQSIRQDQWKESKPGRFRSRGGDEWAELRYNHLVPDPSQWDAIKKGMTLPYPPQPRLISDFCAYNDGTPFETQRIEPIPPAWVGDLTIAAHVELTGEPAMLRLDLVEAGQINRCEIDLSTGQARLSHAGASLGEPAATNLKGRGGHDIRFANVDGRLTLWVDGATPFGDGRVYQEGLEGFAAPTIEDLEPVRIGVQGAQIEVSDLVLTRDIYYTMDPSTWDYDGLGLARGTILSDPGEFSLLRELHWADFSIQPGHYMMLGDNSPRSRDGRAWGLRDRDWAPDGARQKWEVPEGFLIGRAFFVYWPHGKPIWPNIGITKNLRVPFLPYFERMKWIR